MNFKFALLFYLALVSVVMLFLSSCGSSEEKMSREAYVKSVNEWHAERDSSLRAKDSWLSLAGLFEIKEGRFTIGSDSSNDIIFPPGAAPHIGTIIREDSVFAFIANPDARITSKGEEISEKKLKTDEEDAATVLEQNSFLWYVIERHGDYYLRLKDRDHPNFSVFNGIDRFPVSQDWRVKATFNQFDNPKVVTIPDVLGKSYQDSLYGMLKFTIAGEEFNLAPLGNPVKEDQLFIILGDKTNGKSTYDGGRYVYVDSPRDDGTTYIDFNKAYNPPCVFTSFATCPLPPAQNRLDIKITAGEKMVRKTETDH